MLVPMTAMRAAIAVLGLAFGALVVWAIGAASFADSFSAIAADPWGVVSLVDLYLGFVLLAVPMWLVERTPLARAVAIVPMFVLGNLWAALWLALRLPRLVAAIRRA